MQVTTEQDPARRPVIELLYVEACPNYRGTLRLVERARAELGIDTELRTALIVALPLLPWVMRAVSVVAGTGRRR
jgi:hypothetical protein